MCFKFVHHLFFFIALRLITLSSADLFNNADYNEATIYDFVENDPFFEVVQPLSLQYTYRLRQAKNFGAQFARPQRGVRLVLADPEDCCSALYNSRAVQGAVVLVTRGSCSFVTKAAQAERARALAIIVTDTDANTDTAFIEMITDGTARNPSIPAFFLPGRHGDVIRWTLGTHEAIINIPVNLTNTPINQLNQPPWITW